MVTTHSGSQLPRYPNMKPMAAALAVLQMSSLAQAQEAAQTGAPQLEQVIVSANRRIEKLEDVPQSISVLTGETLERNNVREFDDIVNLSPALTISTGTQAVSYTHLTLPTSDLV